MKEEEKGEGEKQNEVYEPVDGAVSPKKNGKFYSRQTKETLAFLGALLALCVNLLQRLCVKQNTAAPLRETKYCSAFAPDDGRYL